MENLRFRQHLRAGSAFAGCKYCSGTGPHPHSSNLLTKVLRRARFTPFAATPQRRCQVVYFDFAHARFSVAFEVPV